MNILLGLMMLIVVPTKFIAVLIVSTLNWVLDEKNNVWGYHFRDISYSVNLFDNPWSEKQNIG